MAATIVGLLLPARQEQQDAAWTSAGERALARVHTPAAFSIAGREGGSQICGNGPGERCLLSPADPTASVGPVEMMLSPLTAGPIRTSCFHVPVVGVPDSCHLVVPVAGSRLVADLFAHPTSMTAPLSKRRYAGAYVVLHVDHR